VISTGSDIGHTSRRSVSVCVSMPSLSERRPSVQPSNTWIVNRSFNANDEQNIQLTPEEVTTLPPPPPPKDPGYIGQRPTKASRRLRVCTSTPHFPSLMSPSAMEREGIIKERSGVSYEKSPTGRSWFFNLTGRANNQRSEVRHDVPENVSNRGNANGMEPALNSMRSNLLVVWARFIGRAMPKTTFHNKGS
jgi:hypothetical protein